MVPSVYPAVCGIQRDADIGIFSLSYYLGIKSDFFSFTLYSVGKGNLGTKQVVGSIEERFLTRGIVLILSLWENYMGAALSSATQHRMPTEFDEVCIRCLYGKWSTLIQGSQVPSAYPCYMRE